jgi:thiamine biosynthesis protein ThiS
MDIYVTVNKEAVALPEGTTVAQLLETRGVRSRSSVWLNGTQLLLAEYTDSILKNGDTVKILRVVAGG